MQGKSMIPILVGKKKEIRSNEPVGWELFGHCALRKGDWKVTRLQDPFGKDKWQLYNLKVDPCETKDLSKRNLTKTRELVALWQAYARENGVILPKSEKKSSKQ